MAKRSCPIDPEDFSSGNPDRGSKQGRDLEGFYQSFGSGCLGNPDHFIERRRENEAGTASHLIEGNLDNESGSAHHFMDPGSGNSWGSDICGMY
jgi:hypothetical protein